MKSILSSCHIPCGYIALILLFSLGILKAPFIIAVFLVGLIFGICLLEAMKLKLWLGFHKTSDVLVTHTRPMVSVHLAVCNEPPNMVISTIKEILKQDYAEYEIIVVDNNTTKRDSWVPVEVFCSTLPNVRFFHLKKWPFFKSGALNFARRVTHKNAEFVFVIDADYRLTPNALELAVSNFDGPNTALVQFPQAYQCDSERHVPLIAEFDHFFNFYCYKADTCHGALATGTLSLIKITALDKVGGWPTNSITEDAELGARLQIAGYDIKYVPRIIGKGIAPIQQEDFIKQRKRWIFGNVQTLMNYSMRPWHNFEKWISGVSQLTAWINMLGIPILILLCCLMLAPWLDQATFVYLSGGAYMAYWIFALSKIVQLQLDQGRRGVGAFRTFLIHFSSLDIGAFDWWPALVGKNRPFIRTNKTKVRSGYKVNLLYPFLHLSLFFCALGFDSFVIAICAITFATLHIMATRFDYLCRAGTNSQIALNLKLH